MDPSWVDPVYQFKRTPREPQTWWVARVGHAFLCFFHAHTPGSPQWPRRTDPGQTQGPCRWCGGHHLWRDGRWVATQE